VEWGRWPKGPLHGMLWAVNRPAGEAPGAEARPLEYSLVREWLLLGPFPAFAQATAGKPAAEKDALEHEYVPGEADLQPPTSTLPPRGGGQGEGIGDLTWKRLAVKKRESDVEQGTEIDWIYFGDLAGKKGENFAYAHAWLWAPAEGRLDFVLDHAGALKAWVNGKAVYSAVKGNLSIWAYNNIGWGWGNYYPTPFGVVAKRVTVTLEKGWNRVLLKANGNVHLRLAACPDAQYETKNIVWMSEMPDMSNSSALVVGDRVFTMADPDELVCVDKRDGKILWRRSNSFFDAVPQAERDAKAAFKEIAELADRRMAAKTFGEKIVLRKQIQDKLEAIDKEKFSMSIEGHPTSHRPVSGWTSPNCTSDGKYVYVWVTNGVAACYGIDGSRKWITRVDLLLRNPGEKYGPYNYPCSPILIGGRFVCAVVYHGMVALNAADGAPAWVNKEVKSSMIHLSGGVVGGTEVVLGNAGEAIRVADGKLLWSNKWNSGTGPSVFIDPVLYLQYLGYVAIDYSARQGDRFDKLTAPSGVEGEWKPTVTPLEAPGLTTYSAPLVHDGLLYYVSRQGELAVLDVNAKKTLYRKTLGVLPLMNYNAAGMCSAPTLGGKHVYLFDNQGVGIVLAPGREYKELARNRIETFVQRDFPTDPLETFYSNPVFEGKRMYLRGEKYLYCIGE
jgi:outer membrane protein assembly factor BamB